MRYSDQLSYTLIKRVSYPKARKRHASVFRAFARSAVCVPESGSTKAWLLATCLLLGRIQWRQNATIIVILLLTARSDCVNYMYDLCSTNCGFIPIVQRTAAKINNQYTYETLGLFPI